MKLGIPRMGVYSNYFKSLLEDLTGCEVVMPSKVSRDMIKAGVANSSDMMCFPYKVTLGQQIWALEHGATDLLMLGSCGICRFRHYHQLQEQTLKKLGYDFNMIVFIKQAAVLRMAIKFFHLTPFNMFRVIRDITTNIRKIEADTYPILETGNLKIGIVGETYTMIESDINFDIVRKLQRMGVNVDMSLIVSNWITAKTKGDTEEKEARKLLTKDIGGHGFQSICNTIWYGKNGYDGVIHLMPLSCMPESTVEVLVDKVADKYNIPLYRFPIDEACFEKGFNTRLETFVSILKRGKR